MFMVMNCTFPIRFTHFITSVSWYCKIISFQLKSTGHSWICMKSMQILNELWITFPGQNLNWGKDAFNHWWLTTLKKELFFLFCCLALNATDSQPCREMETESNQTSKSSLNAVSFFGAFPCRVPLRWGSVMLLVHNPITECRLLLDNPEQKICRLFFLLLFFYF